LKRMRNEADTQAQHFHTYLVEQLLAVSNAVLAAVKNQGNTLQTFSSKVDKSVEHMNGKVERYIEKHQEYAAKQSHDEDAFFKEMLAKNAMLSQQLKAEQEASAEYKKKSHAFMEQMTSLFEAKQKAEEEYITARNNSAAEAIKVVSEAESLAGAFSVQSLDAKVKMGQEGQELEREHKHQASKLLEAKGKAVEQLETDREVVSQATNRIVQQAEAFVNTGKDAWNNHYEKTEAELRKKSDDSSAHVKETQTLTADIRSKMLDSQSKLDTILENQRRSDEREALSSQSEVASQCQETKDFGAAFEDQFQLIGHSLGSFVSEGLKKDTPTGRTPMRTVREFPRAIVRGTPDEERLEKYRSKRQVMIKPSKFELDSAIDDSDSMFSMSTINSELPGGEGDIRTGGGGSSSGLNHSSGSSSALSSVPLSRENSSGSLAKRKKKPAGGNGGGGSVDSTLDNLENMGDVNNRGGFAKPTKIASKLKKPEVIVNAAVGTSVSAGADSSSSSSRSRSGSKTRAAAATAN